MDANALWNKLPMAEGFDDFEPRRAQCGFMVLEDHFECEHSAFGWHVVNGKAVSYLATARPKMGPPPPATATPPSRPGPDDWDLAPLIRLLNHLREQLLPWVEQATDWLRNLPGFFRVHTVVWSEGA